MCGKCAHSISLFIVSHSPDYCSEFIHTRPADPYLSKASPDEAAVGVVRRLEHSQKEIVLSEE